MTKTLTEQWREGTIDYGLYYVRVAYRNDITIAHTIEEDLNVEEVLAPVPSYDEHNESVQKIHILNEQNTKQYNELCEEITKNNILEKKLAIATNALKEINKNYRFTVAQDVVYKALKEMEGVK